MKSPSRRALRRHHRARLIAIRVKDRAPWFSNISPQFVKRATGRLCKTPTPCSCSTCGNPRRHLGRLTMGEKRALLELHDWAQEDGNMDQ